MAEFRGTSKFSFPEKYRLISRQIIRRPYMNTQHETKNRLWLPFRNALKKQWTCISYDSVWRHIPKYFTPQVVLECRPCFCSQQEILFVKTGKIRALKTSWLGMFPLHCDFNALNVQPHLYWNSCVESPYSANLPVLRRNHRWDFSDLSTT